MGAHVGTAQRRGRRAIRQGVIIIGIGTGWHERKSSRVLTDRHSKPGAQSLVRVQSTRQVYVVQAGLTGLTTSVPTSGVQMLPSMQSRLSPG
jgi:hypothetical protein